MSITVAVLALASRLVSPPAPAAPDPPAQHAWPAWTTAAADGLRRADRPACVLVSAYGCAPCRALEDVLFVARPGLRCNGLSVDADEWPQVAEALQALAREHGRAPALPLLLTLAPDGALDWAPTLDAPDAAARARLEHWLVGPPPAATSAPTSTRAPDDDALAAPWLPLLRARTESLTRDSASDELRALDALLVRAARSPYRDHAGGGFHRARTRLAPSVFRYEKRLADNALWLRAFARGYAATGNLVHRDACLGIVAYVVRELRDASGAFWATVDAASGGQDGAFYRWTTADVRAALGAERTAEFLAVYDVVPPGLLMLRGSPFAGLGPSLEVLRARRARRVRPAPDERIIAGPNGLFIGALATSGQKLRRGSDLEAARRAARSVLARLGPVASLRHSTGAHAAGGPATLGDFAYLAEGLLDLEAATQEREWREQAVALVDAALMRLWDPAAQVFRGGEALGPLPAALWHDARDGELPAPQGVMASVLVRLGALTGQARYARLAQRLFDVFARELSAGDAQAPTLAAARRAATAK